MKKKMMRRSRRRRSRRRRSDVCDVCDGATLMRIITIIALFRTVLILFILPGCSRLEVFFPPMVCCKHPVVIGCIGPLPLIPLKNREVIGDHPMIWLKYA